MAAPSLLFDLDGTLVDSVYQHVLAWREALESAGLELSVWRIHRRIGMSGGLFLDALLRETGRRLSAEEESTVLRTHATAFARQMAQIRPLPGARDLLVYLTRAHVPWAIATSGRRNSAQPLLDMLEVPKDVPVVTRDQRWAWDCSPAGTGRTSSRGRGPTACTRIRRICSATSMRSASASSPDVSAETPPGDHRPR